MNLMTGHNTGTIIHSPNPQIALNRGMGNNEGPPPVLVPFGWRRQLIEGRIVYSSPSDCLLWSMNDVAQYIMTDGTCKCGLECPFHLQDLFNFDPICLLQIHATLQEEHQSTSPFFCHHSKKLRQNLQNNHAFYNKQGMEERQCYREQLQHQQQVHHRHQVHPEYIEQQQQQQQQEHYRRQKQLQHHQVINRSQTDHFPVNYSNNHPNYNHPHSEQEQHVVMNGVSPDVYRSQGHHPGQAPGVPHAYHEGSRHPDQHRSQHEMMDKRGQPHDVTAVTAAITDVIPSVGHLIPMNQHHHDIQPPPAHQQRPGSQQHMHPHDHHRIHHPAHFPGQHPESSGHRQQHHHEQHQVHYNVMPQQQILLMPPNDQMLLSPQIVSSFTHSSVNHPGHHVFDPSQQQQQQQHHQQLLFHEPHQFVANHPHTMMVMPSSSDQSVNQAFDRKKPRKRNGQYDRSKKGKTVAAILNLSM